MDPADRSPLGLAALLRFVTGNFVLVNSKLPQFKTLLSKRPTGLRRRRIGSLNMASYSSGLDLSRDRQLRRDSEGQSAWSRNLC